MSATRYSERVPMRRRSCASCRPSWAHLIPSRTAFTKAVFSFVAERNPHTTGTQDARTPRHELLSFANLRWQSSFVPTKGNNYGSNIKYPAGRTDVFVAGARHFHFGHRRQRGGDHARCSRHDHLLRRAFSLRPQYHHPRPALGNRVLPARPRHLAR